MEYKSITMAQAQFKARPKEKTFEGYASTYGNRDLVGDVVHQGAFAKTVAERGPDGSNDIKILWDHFDGFGMPKSFKDNDVGLFMTGKALPLSTTDDRMEMMAGGLYKHLSIGYEAINDKTRFDEDGTRHLHEVKLYEVSVVMFPANEMAHLVAVRKAAEAHALMKSLVGDDLTERVRELKGFDISRLEETVAALSERIADLKAYQERTEPEAPSTPSQPEPPEKPEDEPEELKALLEEIHSFNDELRIVNEVKELSIGGGR